jgi:hypothetical protein
MTFNKHSELDGRHAVLSPSRPYWLNYDEEALDRFYASSYATDIGTLVHEYACDRIQFKMPIDIENDEAKTGLLLHLLKAGIPFRVIDLDRIFTNMVPYVNDAIGYRMEAEVHLKYSDLCFGTADAIGVRGMQLRIHDLKTGTTPAHMEQLLVYAALFFHEYKRDYRPTTMKVELRIYQNNDIVTYQPTLDEIKNTMDCIVAEDRYLTDKALAIQ